MRSDEAVRQLDAAAERVEYLKANIKAAKLRLRDRESVGLPASSGGGGDGSSGAGGVSRPTESAVNSSPSRAESAFAVIKYNELDAAVEELTKASRRAEEITRSVLITKHHAPTMVNEPTCRNCGHAHLANGKPHPKAKEQGPVTNGPLDASGRCAFCRSFFERYHVDPSPEIVLWHLDRPGRRVPYALIRDLHPIEFERHHGRGR